MQGGEVLEMRKAETVLGIICEKRNKTLESRMLGN